MNYMLVVNYIFINFFLNLFVYLIDKLNILKKLETNNYKSFLLNYKYYYQTKR